MHRNRLADETSPYLLQHADNPVDWHPWGEAALSAAQREDKPILLSVGYSACHWCHVMAHESFEDAGIAALMNELFINIKVDREERPDLDKIYQVAQAMLTQRPGGWPLTMFLTPDEQSPFFGGTYFPKEPRFGLPGFGALLRRVAEYYHAHRDEIRRQSDSLKAAFSRLVPDGAAHHSALDATPLAAARSALEQSFDPVFGGFGSAPKFPHAGSIERCLRHWHTTSATTSPDLQALYMATLTLTRMAEGGLYDQLGGGFCRYSVDAQWMIPHFEKMLYDNGPLLGVYADAALATGEPLFARIVRETAAWVLRDMRSPQGAFYSSLDADSEGHEGKFYVWSNAEVQSLLPDAQYQALSRRFGLDRGANFEGAWHLHAFQSLEEVASALGSTPRAVEADLDAARAALLAVRNARIWPARDDKILTAWNALMIKGLAIAARNTQSAALVDAAQAAVDFLRRHLWQDGRLLATYKDGRARLPAYLDDYAFLAEALLELLQTRWRSADLDWLMELVEVMLDKFADPAGGFFFTASDHEKLLHRSKTFTDESTPAGNGVAAAVLCRLGFLVAEPRYLDAAERTLRAAWPQLGHHPQAHMSLLNALDDWTAPVQLVIIRGAAGDIGRWTQQLGKLYAPRRMLFAIPDDAVLPPSLAEKRAVDAGPVAYVCTGMSCSAPVSDLGELARSLTLRLDV
jgi:uncharacterized protein YyaL (SSP411 family)